MLCGQSLSRDRLLPGKVADRKCLGNVLGKCVLQGYCRGCDWLALNAEEESFGREFRFD